VPVADIGSGIPVNSSGRPAGEIAAHDSAVVTFDVRVNAGVATGTVISNQGNVTSAELPSEPTDADGNSSNGYQPTTIIVGSNQQVLITKQVTVVGGGAALANGLTQLDYVVLVTNTGTVTATGVVLSDDLAPLAGQVSYVAGSGTLNGLTGPVVPSGAALNPLITAAYGDLLPGATVQLRFRVLINSGLALGTTITNTGRVTWNAPATATASVSVDVGGIPGSGSLNGHLWHDTNFNNLSDSGEPNLAGWTIGVYRNSVQLGSTISDANGLYSVSGLTPTILGAPATDLYSIRFSAPGAVVTTAKLGLAYSPLASGYTNEMQQISAIGVISGSNQQNLNLPIYPNGVVYNSLLRTPVTGATLTMYRTGSTVALPSTCFPVGSAQQGQVTLSSGFYKFDLNFSNASCPAGVNYLIQVASPLAYMPGQSKIITPIRDAFTPSLFVPACPNTAADAIPLNTYCESQSSAYAPPLTVAANTIGTNYYLHLGLDNPPQSSSQIFNNHIPVDPRLDNAVTITKIASLQNVTRGQIIPYTITVSNTLSVTLTNINIVDTFPPGFKYVARSGRVDGQPVEPISTTRDLTWGNLQLATNTKRVIQLMLIVGSGVKEGKYVNSAQVFNTITSGAASPVATATVRVIPDPTLDCSDVIGKVFDDANLNGYQDEGETGLPGVRVVTAKGLIVTADKFGRFHITCAVVPDPDRGSNYILKVDDRSLPSGYRITTENPRVERATRGKMLKFNFGAAIHKVVKLDMADGVFEPGSTEMRVQWKQRIELLLGELKKAASVLRLSYMAETENESLVNERLKTVKREIARMWKQQKGNYDLTIETEVFWSRGAPPEKSGAND
jgi:large repetitive protein